MSTSMTIEEGLLNEHPEKDLLEKIIVHDYYAHPWIEIVPKEDIPFDILDKVVYPRHMSNYKFKWFRKTELILGVKKELVKEAEKIIQEELGRENRKYKDIIEEFKLAETEEYDYLKKDKVEIEIDDIFIFKNRIQFNWEHIDLTYNIKKKKFLKPNNVDIADFKNFEKHKDVIHAVGFALRNVALCAVRNNTKVSCNIESANNPFVIFVRLDFLNCSFLYKIHADTYVEDIKKIYASLQVSRKDAISFMFMN